jgi:hypothetical protein
MKTIRIIILIFLLYTGLNGCSIFGLDLQKNDKHETHTLDPHIDKSALEYIKSRSNNFTAGDTIFKLMRQAIDYSGIDTNEYKKSIRTYILLHNDAILRLDNNKPTTDCYFGRYLVNGQPASQWSDYPKEQVKNFLLYLIAEGNYTFETVGPDTVVARTLLPPAADTANPKSVIVFKSMNDRNSKFRINDFPGSTWYIEARTAGIIGTNGPLHVVDRVVQYKR